MPSRDLASAQRSVVVPAVCSPHAVTCFRSLGRRGVRTIAPYERPTPAFGSRYCDEPVVVPAPDEDVDAYGEALLSLARRSDVEAIIPMREADVYVLARDRSAFAEAVTPLWPTLESLETVHDRLRLVDVAAEAGVATPETTPLGSVTEWGERQVVKPRFALLTDDYPADRTDAGVVEPSAIRFLGAGEQPDVEAVCEEVDHEPIVQSYVPGPEYALWALYDDGEAVATCGKRQVRGQSFSGGTSVCRHTVDCQTLEAAGRELLDRMEWHGFASVQFKRDEQIGEFTLLEVNPRLWVSVSCPVSAGVDFPGIYWELSNGRHVDVPPTYAEGVTTHRFLGELAHFASVMNGDESFLVAPSATKRGLEIARSLCATPFLDYLSADDPIPFVRDVREKVAHHADPRE